MALIFEQQARESDDGTQGTADLVSDEREEPVLDLVRVAQADRQRVLVLAAQDRDAADALGISLETPQRSCQQAVRRKRIGTGDGKTGCAH